MKRPAPKHYSLIEPLRNADRTLSFTKLLIIYFCGAGAFGIQYTTIFMAMAYGVAFGKSTFEKVIGRLNWSGSESTSSSTSTQTILEKRVIDNGIGFEPAP